MGRTGLRARGVVASLDAPHDPPRCAIPCFWYKPGGGGGRKLLVQAALTGKAGRGQYSEHGPTADALDCTPRPLDTCPTQPNPTNRNAPVLRLRSLPPVSHQRTFPCSAPSTNPQQQPHATHFHPTPAPTRTHQVLPPRPRLALPPPVLLLLQLKRWRQRRQQQPTAAAAPQATRRYPAPAPAVVGLMVVVWMVVP